MVEIFLSCQLSLSAEDWNVFLCFPGGGLLLRLCNCSFCGSEICRVTGEERRAAQTFHPSARFGTRSLGQAGGGWGLSCVGRGGRRPPCDFTSSPPSRWTDRGTALDHRTAWTWRSSAASAKPSAAMPVSRGTGAGCVRVEHYFGE